MTVSGTSISVGLPSKKQKLFTRYLIAILLNLTVLGMVDQYWQNVSVNSFTTTVLVAVILQLMLQLTMGIKHAMSVLFNRVHVFCLTFMRIFCIWIMLFYSKLLTLGIISFLFGDQITFEGPINGRAAFASVIAVMILTEQSVVWIYQRLG